MIFIVGLIISCFLLVLLLLKKMKERADVILGCWLGLILVHLFLFYLRYTEIDIRYPHLLGLLLPLPVLHGVFLYLYTIALISNESILKPKISLHFVSFLVLILLAIPFYSLSAREKVEVFQSSGKGFEWYSLIQLGVILISGFSYSIVSILRIRRHQENIQNVQSNIDRKMLHWLQYLAIGLAMIWLLVLFFNEEIIFIGVVIFVLFIGFFGISQVPVFSNFEVEKKTPKDEIVINNPSQRITAAKYAKSGVEAEELSKTMERLEQLMRSEKPFTNSELTLNELAEKLKIHPNKLSQVINSQTGNTFYHYINIYRVKEFLELSSLPENKKYTFLSLAYDCGFNSKTTFNKYFKIHTGKTPSELL